jgi:hypothetical protein
VRLGRALSLPVGMTPASSALIDARFIARFTGS